MSTDSQLIMANVRHIVYLERYKSGEAKKLKRFIDRVYREINGELAGRNLSTQRQLNTVLSQLDEIINRLKGDVSGYFDEQIAELGQLEADFAKRSIGSVTAPRLAYAGITIDQLRASAYETPFEAKPLRSHIDKYTKSQRKIIRSKIRSGFLSGLTSQEISRSLRPSLELSRRQTDAIVRTGINHIATTAKQTFYRENSDIVSKQKYVAVLDGRTTSTCRARDGKEFDLKGAPAIPAHWNCRSAYIPVLNSDLLNENAPVGTRSSADARSGGSKKTDTIGKPVRATTTQDQYLRKQPKWFLEEVLGKQKAELFRKGGLGVEDFVNNIKQARPLTIDQLRKRHPGAFEKAGL